MSLPVSGLIVCIVSIVIAVGINNAIVEVMDEVDDDWEEVSGEVNEAFGNETLNLPKKSDLSVKNENPIALHAYQDH